MSESGYKYDMDQDIRSYVDLRIEFGDNMDDILKSIGDVIGDVLVDKFGEKKNGKN